MTKEQKVGLFFVIGVILMMVAVELTVGTGLLKEQYHLYVNYDDVAGLNPGDPVRVAGVEMGSVDEITITPEHVRVRLRLDEEAEVRRNSVARLDFQALSGARFISISLGSPDAPVLKEGDTIHGERTADLAEMIDQLEDVGRSVTELAESLNRNQDELLRNINELIEENRSALTLVASNLASITEKLDRGEGTVAKLINDPALYEEAERLLVQANRVLGDLRQVSVQLAEGRGSLGRLVHEDAMYDEVRETLASLQTSARNLESISNDLRDGRGTLGRLLTDDALYVEAENAVRSLDRATSGIEDQAPISILGTFISTLF